MTELQIFLPGILLSYSAFLIGIASPGPNVLATMGTSMSVGRPKGLSLAFGVSLGSLCWATLAVSGVTALLNAYSSAILLIKIFGGLYLLWLAYKAFKSAASKHELETNSITNRPRRLSQYFRSGLLVQMTNPKAALAWVAIISLGVQDNAPTWVGLAIVGGTFALSLMAHSLYALAFSTPSMVRLYGKARRTIQATLGTFFTFAGLKLLTSRT